MREIRPLRLTWRELETWPRRNCEPTARSKERDLETLHLPCARQFLDLPRLRGHPEKHESAVGVDDGETRRGQVQVSLSGPWGEGFWVLICVFGRSRKSSAGFQQLLADDAAVASSAARWWSTKPILAPLKIATSRSLNTVGKAIKRSFFPLVTPT